jgi:DNA-binding CsgD family transcriptional regulator
MNASVVQAARVFSLALGLVRHMEDEAACDHSRPAMTEAEQLSHLIEHIYHAVRDTTRWPGVIEEACGFVRGCAADLSYHDLAGSCVTVACCWGEEAFNQRYVDTYAELNPLLRASSRLEAGTVHALADIMPLREFRETRFYREWAEPQGLGEVILASLERTATGCATIAIWRRDCDGIFDEDARSRFRLILPHVRRAVSIGRVIDFHKASAADLSKAFDGLAAAVVLVSSDECVVFANGQGAAMLARGEILRARQGRLTAVEPKADCELRAAIADASRGDATLSMKGRAIALASRGTTTHVAHILSLGKHGDPASSHAVAALFVRPVTASSSCLEVLAKSCQLTASEMRVLDAVIMIGSVGDLADRLGITKATVKTHLNHLFAKTGTRRQSDLIRLATRYASPLIL